MQPSAAGPSPESVCGAVISSLLLLAGSLIANAPGDPVCVTSVPADFTNPQRVTIRGYNGEAMEPFLTRDGKYLFFNNSVDPQVNTNLHWAGRIDDLIFQCQGGIGGINTGALEGVPSLDRTVSSTSSPPEATTRPLPPSIGESLPTAASRAPSSRPASRPPLRASLTSTPKSARTVTHCISWRVNSVWQAVLRPPKS